MHKTWGKECPKCDGECNVAEPTPRKYIDRNGWTVSRTTPFAIPVYSQETCPTCKGHGRVIFEGGSSCVLCDAQIQLGQPRICMWCLWNFLKEMHGIK